MLRIILIILLIMFIFGIVRSIWRDVLDSINRQQKASRRSRSGPQPPPLPTDTLVQDPVCGVYCPKKKALTAIYKGKVYYFCSEECRQKFINEHMASSRD